MKNFIKLTEFITQGYKDRYLNKKTSKQMSDQRHQHTMIDRQHKLKLAFPL